MDDKTYRVKVLDFSYQQEFSILSFKYLFYEVKAHHREEALKIAYGRYVNGEKEMCSEELPFLLKILTVDSG